ncbi:MAG: portal protein [Micropepsaceae bacterium]
MSLRTPNELVSHCNRLKAERTVFEQHWREIAHYMRPHCARALGGEAKFALMDSTAKLAAENFASGIYGMMTNPANRWFALRLHDEDLNSFDPVRDWLYEVETRMLASFGPQSSRFYAVLPALYADLATFGTAVFYSEEIAGTGSFSDTVRPLAECFVAESASGEIDTVFRRFTLTPRQAVSLFGDSVSPRTARGAARNDLERVTFLHCVHANDEALPGSPAPHARPFLSVYVEEDGARMVGSGGYFEMPYQVPRWLQTPGEAYGRGIGDQVLPDMRLLARMEETALRAAQLMADPPMAVPDRGLAKAARTVPGGISYGALDQSGNLRIKPIYTGANPAITLEMIENRRQAIREAFHFQLLQMSGSPNMTATEWMGRQEEKLRLLGPNLGRIQSEFLSPLIRRRFGMLLRAGQLPEPPPEIRGQCMCVDYVSPLARAQLAGEAQAVARLYENLDTITKFDPTIAGNLDHAHALEVMAQGWAVPARILRGG